MRIIILLLVLGMILMPKGIGTLYQGENYVITGTITNGGGVKVQGDYIAQSIIGQDSVALMEGENIASRTGVQSSITTESVTVAITTTTTVPTTTLKTAGDTYIIITNNWKDWLW